MTDEEYTPPPGIELFDSAEEAALSEWQSTPSAHARVVGVEPSDQFDGVYVTIQLDGHPGFHDLEITGCLRAPNGRWLTNGSVVG